MARQIGATTRCFKLRCVLVNYGLDAALQKLATRFKGRYTRYADDITFSFPKDYPKKMRSVLETTRRRLRARGYRSNRKKQRILRRHQQQTFTGLVVNDNVNLPRRIRRQLRAIEHRLHHGEEATMTREQLDGWKAYLAMVKQAK